MAYTPEQSPNLQTQRDAENRVKDAPRGNFQFAYHPDEWQLNERGQLVPTVVHLSKEPGNGGVDGSGDFTMAEVQYRKRGYVLIPHDILGGDQDYVALYRNKRGKKVHRTIFQDPYDNAAGVTEWAFDAEAWEAFIQLLRKKGFVKQPRTKIVEGMLEDKKMELDNHLRREPSRDQPDRHERWEKKLTLKKLQIGTLETELEASYAAWGRPASPGRSRVMKMLEAANETGDPDVDDVRKKAARGRLAAADAATAVDEDDIDDEDDDLPVKDAGKASAKDASPGKGAAAKPDASKGKGSKE